MIQQYVISELEIHLPETSCRRHSDVFNVAWYVFLAAYLAETTICSSCPGGFVWI